MPRAQVVLAVAFGAAALVTCKRDAPEQSARDDTVTAPGRPTAAQTATGGTGATGLEVVDENMARNFEGRLRLKVRGTSDFDVQYLSRGDKGRMQIQPTATAKVPRFDAIISNDHVSILSHERKQYHELPLDDVARETSDNDKGDASLKLTGERKMVHGLTCNVATMTSKELNISACVRGLPGQLAPDKLETLIGVDLPPWVELLAAQGYLPVTAKVTDEAGKLLHSVDVAQYSPEQVPEEEFAIPANYARIK